MTMYEVVLGGKFKVIVDVAADSREEAETLAEAELIRVGDETGFEFEILSTGTDSV